MVPRPRGRVLSIERVQDVVEIRVAMPQSDRLIEEMFRCDREELGFVGRTVRVEQSRFAPLRAIAETLVLLRTHLDPARILGAPVQEWGAVGATVEHVEFVSEFVIDDVMAALGMTTRTLDRIPD